jgi:hypothetical protein
MIGYVGVPHQPRPGPGLRDRLEGIADAYSAMDERRAIKSLVRVGSV